MRVVAQTVDRVLGQTTVTPLLGALVDTVGVVTCECGSRGSGSVIARLEPPRPPPPDEKGSCESVTGTIEQGLSL